MIDYFALLQQPRKPWLDPEELKQRYQQLTLASHPDRQSTNTKSADSRTDFTAINEAYRVLLDPKLRLQHLLKLEGIPIDAGMVPETLSDVFLEIGTLIQEIDRLLTKSTYTALSKALLRSELMEKQKLTADLLDKLQTMCERALKELKALDQTWTSNQKVAAELSDLASRFAYLIRWIDQLEERRFQLSIL